MNDRAYREFVTSSATEELERIEKEFGERQADIRNGRVSVKYASPEFVERGNQLLFQALHEIKALLKVIQ